jgi:hypothetical protein
MFARRLLFLFVLALTASSAVASEQPWVLLDASGKLVYRTLPRGDRIIDFSYAGYMGGGVPLPKVPAVRTITPSGGDDSLPIQQAIDEISAQIAQDHKPRAIQLAAGTFLCSRMTSRDFKAAYSNRKTIVDGPERELRAARSTGWLTREQVATLNRQIQSMIRANIGSPPRKDDARLFALTVVMTPLRR